jgi:hypothetical protein
VKRSGAPSIGDIVKYRYQGKDGELKCTALIVRERSIWVQILPLVKPSEPPDPRLHAHNLQGGWIEKGETWIPRAKCEVLNLNNRNY